MRVRASHNSFQSSSALNGVDGGTVIGGGILALVLNSLIIEIIVLLGLGLGGGRT